MSDHVDFDYDFMPDGDRGGPRPPKSRITEDGARRILMKTKTGDARWDDWNEWIGSDVPGHDPPEYSYSWMYLIVCLFGSPRDRNLEYLFAAISWWWQQLLHKADKETSSDEDLSGIPDLDGPDPVKYRWYYTEYRKACEERLCALIAVLLDVARTGEAMDEERRAVLAMAILVLSLSIGHTPPIDADSDPVWLRGLGVLIKAARDCLIVFKEVHLALACETSMPEHNAPPNLSDDEPSASPRPCPRGLLKTCAKVIGDLIAADESPSVPVEDIKEAVSATMGATRDKMASIVEGLR